MSWEWSHTPEAYHNARENLERLPIYTLCEILAEWEASVPGERKGSLDIDKFDRRYKHHKAQVRSGLSKEALANSIWDYAEEQRVCDNGGHNAWMCPHGCNRHSVSFSTFSERMAEAKQRKADNRRLRRNISNFNDQTKTTKPKVEI